MPPDRYPPSYSDTPGACPQARHKPLSSPTAVPRVRSCPCRITLHLSAKSPFHGPEAIQRTTSTASRCKRDSAALRTADFARSSLTRQPEKADNRAYDPENLENAGLEPV